MTENEKQRLVNKCIDENDIYDLMLIRNTLYTSQVWNMLVDSNDEVKQFIMKYQRCPYCLTELSMRVSKWRHGDITELHLTEYFTVYSCVNGCILD